MESYLYKNIKTNTTTVICSQASILHAITVNTTAAGAITVYDGTTEVAILKASIAEGTYFFDVVINRALSIVTAGASNITVAYKPAT